MSCAATQDLDTRIATARQLLADLETQITERLAELTTLEAAIRAMQRYLVQREPAAHTRLIGED